MVPVETMPFETDVTYEELAALEYEFDDADQQLVRQQEKLLAPLYSKRATFAARIPNFWALVLEQAPTEFDQFVTPTDSQLFAEALDDIHIERFEVDKDPRSILVRMKFRENQWFRDVVLEKKFYSRRSRDGWTGLVSEPVPISWKSKEKDLTGGLTDAASKLWKARQASANKDGTKPAAQEKLKEHQSLAKILESNDPTGTSFFTFFGFVSERRWVSAEESDEAIKALKVKRAVAAEANGKGAEQKIDEINDEEEELEASRAEAEQSVEICPQGSDLVNVMAEDIWPHAIRYFSKLAHISTWRYFVQTRD